VLLHQSFGKLSGARGRAQLLAAPAFVLSSTHACPVFFSGNFLAPFTRPRAEAAGCSRDQCYAWGWEEPPRANVSEAADHTLVVLFCLPPPASHSISVPGLFRRRCPSPEASLTRWRQQWRGRRMLWSGGPHVPVPDVCLMSWAYEFRLGESEMIRWWCSSSGPEFITMECPRPRAEYLTQV
jgi:hypothetical protein